MKINLSTVLIGATIALLLLKPQVATPIVPLPDEPLPEDPDIIEPGNNNVVDVYTTGSDGSQIYHHTEITNPDGTVDIYVMNASGDLVYLKPKPVKPVQSQTVSGMSKRKGAYPEASFRSASGTNGIF